MRIHGSSGGGEKHQSGTALLTMLTLVSLAVILVFSYFHRARVVLLTSEDKDREIKVQDVAETAVNLVIAQIRSATTMEHSGWASQPGVIRVWGEDGRFEKGYKLYSDETMVERDERALVGRDFSEMANDWKKRDWIYTDLNAPTKQGTEWVFPILDPAAKEIHEIEGFDFDNLRVGGASELNPLPMPVKWIYQLEDGTLGMLDSGRRFVATRGAVTPTRDNQIVARFAFWADDETCKLNVNVNAGGMATSAQFAGGDLDRNFQRYPPSQNEWQRFPGHPATTSLAPVFAPGDREMVAPSGRDRVKGLYDLIPRVAHGGSRSGTGLPDLRGDEPNGLVADRDRLLPGLDDLILRPNRETAKFPDKVSAGDEDLFLRRARFFLTSENGSPETTFTGRPRVSIWPTYFGEGADAEARRTTRDDWLRVCAEVGVGKGGKPLAYHFQRRNADSATGDFDEIPRNQELFAYLDRLTGERMPGIGKSYAGKYSKDERLQILTEIFDYIRCTNLHDDNLFGEGWRAAYTDADQNTDGHLTFTNGRIDDWQPLSQVNGQPTERSSYSVGKVHKGFGQVTPIRITHDGVESQGIGRFYTMQEMGVQVIACAEGGDGTGGGGSRLLTLNTRSGAVADAFENRDVFSNFPPLPLTVDADDESTWPHWLRELKDLSPDLVATAFAPENWNWQLAWLDPAYAAAMPEAKFDRRFLRDAGVTRLKAGETLVQAGLIWNMTCPSLGWPPINPDLAVDFEVEGMNFRSATGESVSLAWNQKPEFGAAGPGESAWLSNRSTGTRSDGLYGGVKPVDYFPGAGERLPGAIRFDNIGPRLTPVEEGWLPSGVSVDGRSSPVDRNYAASERWNQYPFISRPFKISGEVNFSGGKVDVRIYAAGKDSGTERSAAQVRKSELVQQLEMVFPAFSVEGPELEGPSQDSESPGRVGPMSYWSLSWDGANPHIASVGRLAMAGSSGHGDFHRRGDVVQSIAVDHADVRLLATKSAVSGSDGLFQPVHNYGERRQAFVFQNSLGLRLRPEDEGGHLASARLLPGIRYPAGKGPYPMAAADPLEVQCYGDFDSGLGMLMDGSWINRPDEGNGHTLLNRTDFKPSQRPRTTLFLRDWDSAEHSLGYRGFSSAGDQSPQPSYYTPNRIVNSPGVFGSLPVGTTSNQPWRTLLFRPDVEGGLYKSHPGAAKGDAPPDHLLLDLFWMPIVEPFSLSEAYATRGKVNLNYQILPFRHVRRDTALRGVLQSETQLCIPNKWSQDYKTGFGRGRGYHWRYSPFEGSLQQKSLRALFVADDTLEQFEDRFNDLANPTLFRTASEICDVHLIPESFPEAMGNEDTIGTYTPTVEQMANGKYWSDHALVGDNARETPYSNIYSRVTTRSNTYTVHCKAQVLKQVRREEGGSYAIWDSERDSVVAEESNATRIERYLDVTDLAIPDYATEPNAPSLGRFYRYRVVQRRGGL